MAQWQQSAAANAKQQPPQTLTSQLCILAKGGKCCKHALQVWIAGRLLKGCRIRCRRCFLCLEGSGCRLGCGSRCRRAVRCSRSGCRLNEQCLSLQVAA